MVRKKEARRSGEMIRGTMSGRIRENTWRGGEHIDWNRRSKVFTSRGKSRMRREGATRE